MIKREEIKDHAHFFFTWEKQNLYIFTYNSDMSMAKKNMWANGKIRKQIMIDKSSNWVTSTVSVSWKKLPAVPIFPSSTLRTTHALKVLLLYSYSNIMYYLTNLSYVLKLLSLCFIFSCLVGDKMNQKDKKSHNQDLSNLALGYCLTAFHKSRLFSGFHFSHL